MAEMELTYESAFPGRFTKAALLNGRKVTVAIDQAYMEVLEGEKGKENKLIMKFRGAKMEMVVNKTNALCCKEMFGSKIGAWVGKRITLYPTTTNFGPKKVDAIRIYGSPDIASDIEISARIGRKQFKATMHKVQAGAQPVQATEAQEAVSQSAPDFDFQFNPDAEPEEAR